MRSRVWFLCDVDVDFEVRGEYEFVGSKGSK